MQKITVVRLIDHGGFGAVHEVRMGARRLAQKSFDPRTTIQPEERAKLLERFLREFRIQSALDHENIMPIVAEVNSDPPSFLMPLADEDYREQIKRDRSNGVPTLQPLLHILAGLEELHRMEFVHRDLKPANVLLVKGVWKLSDFGLAMPPPSDTSRLTSSSSAWGTADYAAPEQAHAFSDVTTAADIFSFGCVLHDIAGTAARVPFARATARGPIGAIIERCTEQDPADRFADVSALRTALLFALDPSMASAGATIADDVVAQRLKDGDALSPDEWEHVVRLIEAEPVDRGFALMLIIERQQLKVLHRDHPRLFARLAPLLCEMMAVGVFSFDFCDVLAARLETIADIGSVRDKADAAMTSLTLGCSHNRWAVMRTFVRLVQPGDPDVADRIAVALLAEGQKAIVRIRRLEGTIPVPPRESMYDSRILRAIEELERRHPKLKPKS